jgi:hypothetical protein
VICVWAKTASGIMTTATQVSQASHLKALLYIALFIS